MRVDRSSAPQGDHSPCIMVRSDYVSWLPEVYLQVWAGGAMQSDVLRRNHVTTKGRGARPLVFGHGFGSDQRIWRQVVPEFEASYHIALFDHLGWGRSDFSAYDPKRHATLHGFADDVLEILAALDLSDVIFVGHSVGAIIGALAARRRPEQFDCLIMIGASPRYIDDPPSYTGGFSRKEVTEILRMLDRSFDSFAHFFAPINVQNRDRPELQEELAQQMLCGDPEIARRFARAIFLGDYREDVRGLSTPTLLLQSADDTIAPPSVAEYLHQQLANSTLRYMRATGHCPHISHPAETCSLIKEFLEHRYSS